MATDILPRPKSADEAHDARLSCLTVLYDDDCGVCRIVSRQTPQSSSYRTVRQLRRASCASSADFGRGRMSVAMAGYGTPLCAVCAARIGESGLPAGERWALRVQARYARPHGRQSSAPAALK